LEEEVETSFLDSGDVDMETWGLSRQKFKGHTEKTKSISLRQNRYNKYEASTEKLMSGQQEKKLYTVM
jgi:hypothetical protein